MTFTGIDDKNCYTLALPPRFFANKTNSFGGDSVVGDDAGSIEFLCDAEAMFSGDLLNGDLDGAAAVSGMDPNDDISDDERDGSDGDDLLLAALVAQLQLSDSGNSSGVPSDRRVARIRKLQLGLRMAISL